MLTAGNLLPHSVCYKKEMEEFQPTGQHVRGKTSYGVQHSRQVGSQLPQKQWKRAKTRISQIVLAITAAVICMYGVPAHALTNEQQHAFNQQTYYFNTEDCAPGSTSLLIGHDPEEQAFNYFASKGLSPVTTAAIVGNLYWESTMDPEKVQGDGDSTDPSNLTTSGHGYGIAQWDPGAKLIKIAYDLNITDPFYQLPAQLDIVWKEVTTSAPTGYSNVLGGMQGIDQGSADQQTKLNQETAFFQQKFESGTDFAHRFQAAQDALSQWGSTIQTPSQSNPNSTGCGSLTGTGSSSNLGGVWFESQRDPRFYGKDICWAPGSTHGCDTIYNEGCWATAVAMIISTFIGHEVTPMQTEGDGLPHESFASEGLHQEQHFGTMNTAAINAALAKIQDTSNPALVLIGGSGGLPFYTTPSHYVVLRGVDSAGNILVNDPWDLPTPSNPNQPQAGGHSLTSFPKSDLTATVYYWDIVTKH